MQNNYQPLQSFKLLNGSKAKRATRSSSGIKVKVPTSPAFIYASVVKNIPQPASQIRSGNDSGMVFPCDVFEPCVLPDNQSAFPDIIAESQSGKGIWRS